MQLSEHFGLEELTHTEVRQFGNTPPAEIVERLVRTANGLEAVRAVLLGEPIRVNSGYRSARVNRAVGGAVDSAHIKGWACDFTCRGFGPPLQVCRAIVKSGVAFDQLIEEGTWIHISFDPRMRGEVLTKRPRGGYQAGLRED